MRKNMSIFVYVYICNIYTIYADVYIFVYICICVFTRVLVYMWVLRMLGTFLRRWEKGELDCSRPLHSIATNPTYTPPALLHSQLTSHAMQCNDNSLMQSDEIVEQSLRVCNACVVKTHLKRLWVDQKQIKIHFIVKRFVISLPYGTHPWVVRISKVIETAMAMGRKICKKHKNW